MIRVARLIVVSLALTGIANAQSDSELLAKVHARLEKIYLDQASFTLPDSFFNNGLEPKAEAKLVEGWANGSASCHLELLQASSLEHEIPLADLVADDGSYTNKLPVDANWKYRLKMCLDLVWETVGATPYPD